MSYDLWKGLSVNASGSPITLQALQDWADKAREPKFWPIRTVSRAEYEWLMKQFSDAKRYKKVEE